MKKSKKQIKTKPPISVCKSITHMDWIHIAAINILAILLTFVVVKVFENLSIFTPKERSGDYEMADFYQSIAQDMVDTKMSNHIVIVSVDDFRADDIIRSLSIISDYHPKAIGLDVLFTESKKVDTLFMKTVANTPNLVFATEIKQDVDNTSCFHVNEKYFHEPLENIRYGYANLVANTNRDVVRYFRPFVFENNQHDTLISFPAALAKMIYPNSYNQLIKKQTDFERISFVNEKEHLEFDTLNLNDVLSRKVPEELIRGKVVFIGMLHNSKDTYLTSMRGSMSGVMIHAYVLQMIINGDYIYNTNKMFNWLFALVASFLLIFICMLAKKYMPNLGNLLIRVIQFILIVLIFSIGAWVYTKAHKYIDFYMTEIIIGLSVVAFDIWFGLYALFNKFIIKNTLK